MASRTFQLVNSLVDATGAPLVARGVTATLLIPGNVPAIDTDGKAVSTDPITMNTDSSGHYAFTLLYPGDISPAGCIWQVKEPNHTINSPLGFPYAATITTTAWYGAPGPTGTVRCRLDVVHGDDSAVTGRFVHISAQQNATTPDGTFLSTGVPLDIALDALGRATFWLWPSSVLAPVTNYLCRIDNEPTRISFSVPSGTSDPLGENILLHTAPFGAAQLSQLPTAGVEHSAEVVPALGEPDQTPASLDDDLANLVYRIANTTGGGSGGGGLTMADGATTLTAVTKINFSGATLSGTPSNAFLATKVATTSSLGVVQADGTTIAVNGAGVIRALGMTDPTTTKGDMIARGTSITRLPAGADGQVLTSDSTQTLGLRWAAAPTMPTGPLGGRGPATVGALYFDTTPGNNHLYVADGTQWQYLWPPACGVASVRPATAPAGVTYFATDTFVLSVSDGSAWHAISAGGGYTLPAASASVLGGVKIGSGVTVAGDGTISVSGGGSGGGGGGVVILGTQTQGSSNASGGANALCFVKKFTPASNGLMESVLVWAQGDGSHVPNLGAVVYADNAGVPGMIIGAVSANNTAFLSTTWRQVTLPCGYYATAGVPVWVGVNLGNQGNIAFNTGGGDYAISSGGAWAVEGPGTGTGNNYSIAVSFRPDGGGGGLTQIQNVLVSTAQPTIDFTAIPGTYSVLRLALVGRGDTAAQNVGVNMRLNNDSAANYQHQSTLAQATTQQAGSSTAQTSNYLGSISAASATAGLAGNVSAEVMFYANTSFNKGYLARSSRFDSSTQMYEENAGTWQNTAAVTRLTLSLAAGNFAPGTHAVLYGIT